MLSNHGGVEERACMAGSFFVDCVTISLGSNSLVGG